MNYDDIQVGMRLIQPNVNVPCEVTYHGPRSFDVECPDGSFASFYPEDATQFEPDVMANLLGHPAVGKHGEGVTSAELADFTRSLSGLSQARVMGTGHQQYATGKLQRFEELSPAELGRELLEELADAMNYLAMVGIKAADALAALTAALEKEPS